MRLGGREGSERIRGKVGSDRGAKYIGITQRNRRILYLSRDCGDKPCGRTEPYQI